MKKNAILKLLLVMLFAVSVVLLASCSESYVVSFDSDGGSAVESVEIEEGQTLIEPVTEKEGYTFLGWYLDNDKWDFQHYQITGDMTLKAKWSKNHTVTFDSGSTTASVTVVDGQKVTAPANPIKDSAEFMGWYIGDTKWNFAETPVTEDITLTAKWRGIFSVKFDSDGGDVIPAQAVKSGDCATLPKVPSRYGYEFDGWYYGTQPWDFTTEVKSDITLKAKWTPVYTVSFYTDGAGNIDSQKILNGSLAKVPATPQKTGYIFDGWFNGDTAWNFSTDKVTANVKLTAKWTLVTYNVSFDKDNGDAVTTLNVIPGEKISAPEDPTKAGYAFDGWYAGDALWNFDTDVVAEAVTLKAKWIKTWEVKFTAGDDAKTFTVKDGEKLEKFDDPSKDGFRFDGWFNGDEKWEFDTPITDTISLVAKFTAKYTVKFDLDGAESDSIEDSIYFDGDKITKPQDPKKPGYTFDGWYAGDALWNFDTDTVSADVTLKAKWAKNFTVIFLDREDGSKIGHVQVPEGHTIAIPEAPTKTFYNFVCWETADKVEWDFDTPITEDNFKLYASWAENYWTITFKTDENDRGKSIRITRGERIERPATNPEKEGLAFVEWCYHIGGADYAWDFDMKPESNITLTATWTNNFWTVKFVDDKNPEISSKTHNVAKGGLVNNPYASGAPAVENFKFFGWVSTSSNKIWNFETNTVESDMELHAMWLKACTITLVFDNGDSPLSFTKYEGESLGINFNPTRPGHRFIGWFDEQGNKFDVKNTALTDNVTLTARWEATVTVYYDLMGGYTDSDSYVDFETVKKGEKFTAPTVTPKKSKYEFLGWATEDGTLWTFESDVAETDIVLRAEWAPKYYVEFDLNGGVGNISKQEISKNGVATKPAADPTRDYMTFGGWYLNGEAYEFGTPVTEDVTLVAKWNPIYVNVTFDTDGGVSDGGALYGEYEAGKTLTAPIVTLAGYVLKYWELPDGTMWNFETDVLPVVNEDVTITLKAIWTNEKIKVIFDVAGGTPSIPSQTVDYNSLIAKPEDPTKNGLIFKGWYLDDGTKWDFATSTAKSNVTLTAKWEQDYLVKFDTDGGAENYDDKRVALGGYVEAPTAPTKYGYDFIGWFVNGGTTKWDFQTMTVSEDIVLVAKWQIKTFTVTFVTSKPNQDELAVLSTQTVTYGELVARPETPDIGINYEFDSWRDKKGNVWHFNVNVVESDMTLYAYWITSGVEPDDGFIGPWDEVGVQGPMDNF